MHHQNTKPVRICLTVLLLSLILLCMPSLALAADETAQVTTPAQWLEVMRQVLTDLGVQMEDEFTLLEGNGNEIREIMLSLENKFCLHRVLKDEETMLNYFLYCTPDYWEEEPEAASQLFQQVAVACFMAVDPTFTAEEAEVLFAELGAGMSEVELSQEVRGLTYAIEPSTDLRTPPKLVVEDTVRWNAIYGW